MKCTIIGGGGFLGSHLCEHLIEQGHRVNVFESPKARYLEMIKSLGAEIFLGDFLNPTDLKSGITNCDVLFHLVSTTDPKKSNDDPAYDIQSNLVGSVNLLSEIVKKSIGKIIFASSGGTVYGIPQETPIKENHETNPISSYGITKLAIEKYLALFERLYSQDYTVLRIANAYGERQPVHGSQGVIGAFLEKAIEKQQVEIWGEGNQIRDFVYAKDITTAMEKAMTYTGEQRVLNIGSGEGHSINDILRTIETVIHASLAVKYLPARQFDVPVNVLDSSAAMKNLNWQPVTRLPEGIERSYRWMLIHS